ncbi:hypothetical protein Plhal710r2_c023g0094491 [Plasmopara halstedii]
MATRISTVVIVRHRHFLTRIVVPQSREMSCGPTSSPGSNPLSCEVAGIPRFREFVGVYNAFWASVLRSQRQNNDKLRVTKPHCSPAFHWVPLSCLLLSRDTRNSPSSGGIAIAHQSAENSVFSRDRRLHSWR